MTARPRASRLSTDRWSACPPGTRSTDRGSGTVWSLIVITVIASIAVAALVIGGAVVTRHRAGSAADFAALAAADAVARAEADPCAAARRVTEQYGADLTACMVDGMVVDVVVSLGAGGLVGDGRSAVVRARAGPP